MVRNGRRISVSLLLLSVAVRMNAQAHMAVSRIFSDHMVLQRDRPIHIWGTASAGELISVTLDSGVQSTITDTLRRWNVYLPPHAVGGPFTITVKGSEVTEIKDVLIGDVWVASGQSNMEMTLAGFPDAPVANAAEAIAKADIPSIRLVKIPRTTSAYPLVDAPALTHWVVCNQDTVKDVSAVGYFFSRNIHEREKVPIGLIDSTWGGTPAEGWISLYGLSRSSALQPVMESRGIAMNFEEAANRREESERMAFEQGHPPAVFHGHPELVSSEPAALFNAMIAPLTKMAIRGVIWYQGESNAKKGRAFVYDRLFRSLIQDWRARWAIGDFPFLFVQISAFAASDVDWPMLRDAQRRSLDVTQTGMAVTIDLADRDPTNVHPARKSEVADRLALLARSLAYGEIVTANGPLFRQAVPQGDAMRIFFDHASGLKSIGGVPEEFEVAGEDGVFVPAIARIDGDTVIARSSTVPAPVHVRYAWKSYPKSANLYNSAELPASPFTSQQVESVPQDIETK